MSSINNISGSNSSLYLQPAANATQSVNGSVSDSDNGSSSNAAQVGKSTFMNAIEQALGQTVSGNSATKTSTSDASVSSDPAQNPQALLQSFMHSLFAALHQSGGHGNGAAAISKGGDSDGDHDASSSVSKTGHHHGGGSSMASKIQNLIQQLSSSGSSTSTDSQSSNTDALNNLTSSFQNLMNTIGKSQGQAASAASPTLQSFLQNLQQDISGGQNISGAVVSTKV